MKPRLIYIDFLRAVAIIGVMIVHAFQYHLVSPTITFVWNYLHFVVVAFVFASGYVLATVNTDTIQSPRGILSWYKRRFVRLAVPFYIYLVVHNALWELFPRTFSGFGLSQISTPLIIKSVTFTGGEDITWLPLLFLELTILYPFLIRLLRARALTIIYIIAAVSISVLATFWHGLYPYYRVLFWLPWSLILIFGLFLHEIDQRRESKHAYVVRYIWYAVGAAFVFLLALGISGIPFSSIRLVDRKFPPDIFYLSVGVVGIALVLSARRIFEVHPMGRQVWTFISKHAYDLFFIHYIVIDFLLTTTAVRSNPVVFAVLTVSLSVFIAWLIQFVFRKIKNNHSL